MKFAFQFIYKLPNNTINYLLIDSFSLGSYNMLLIIPLFESFLLLNF